jgi:hypothetical protein
MLRARLKERVDLYVQYERTKQLDKLYDLLFEPGETKKAFLKRLQSAERRIQHEGNPEGINPLLGFAPTSIEFVDGDEIKPGVTSGAIYGCGEYPFGKVKVMLGIWLVKDEWYFDLAQVQLSAFTTQPCDN